MPDCLFCKIAAHEIPSTVLYEDKDLITFRDIEPQAPFHILIVPKQHIQSAADLSAQHATLLAKVFETAAKLCIQEGITNGYRVVTNIGPDGAQSVPHLHFHVLGGRQLGWPPG